MKKALLFLLLLPLLSACDTKEVGEVYLFTYFIGQEDGLRLAYSRDGLNWKNISDTATFIKPEVGSSLMRDPSAVMGPDGTYHLVWTTGWNDDCIGHASTKDFINWSEPLNGDFWAEGPTSFYEGDDIYVYFDRYKDRKFGTVKSSDGGKTWTDISDQVSLPDGIRHGSVITVPEELVERIKCYVCSDSCSD